MNVFVRNLNEDGSGIRQEIPDNGQPIPQIRQVGMNAVPPGVPEGLHLLRLARDMINFAVLDIATRGGPLEVGVELDAVRRVNIDALDLAPEAFALRERGIIKF